MRSGFCATLLIAALFPAWGAAGTVYFLVAETPGAEVHNDSYVLPLSDPAQIAHARALIDGTATDGKIVTARIAEGANGINRDYRAVGTPEWSWHVTEFLGFADNTIEVLDGWPSDVERDVPAWMANTNSQVGFWSYTVVEELPAVPEPASAGLAVVALGAGAVTWGIRRVRRK
jgi:hypothetical protein